jgi:hypothetical protein
MAIHVICSANCREPVESEMAPMMGGEIMSPKTWEEKMSTA